MFKKSQYREEAIPLISYDPDTQSKPRYYLANHFSGYILYDEAIEFL
jgi:hypothetical protein